MHIRRLACLLAATTLASAAHATIIFDNASVASNSSVTIGSGDPLAIVTVATPTAINQIGALIDLNGSASGNPGSLKFLIFDDATGNLLFNSGAQVFVDDGLTFKLSNVFTPFMLMPGVTYDIGAIADGVATYATGTPISDFTQNGITAAHNRNGNALNYNNPSLAAQRGLVMVAIELGAAGQVPEPGTIGLLALGAAAATFKRRKRSCRGA